MMTNHPEQIVNHIAENHTESDVIVTEQPLTSNSVPFVEPVSEKETEENHVIYNELSKLKPLETSRLPMPVKNVKSSLKTIICGSTFVLIVTAVISILPILQLVVGERYADQCPANWHIPHYLLVAGIAGLSTILLALIFVSITLYVTSQLKETDARAPNLPISCGLCGILLFLICFVVFLCGWFTIGFIWVFKIWNTVQYNTSYRTDYCNPILYRFTYGSILISIISYGFTCIISCSQGRKLLIISRHDASIRVSTVEP